MTKTQLKKELLAAQISYKRSEYNENSLYADLHNFFLNLKQKVLKELEEYYNPDFMFQGQVDLILAPIFESQKQYYKIILKHIKKEYRFGKAEGKRLVHNAQKRTNLINKGINADKSQKIPMSSIIKKDELFGTSDFAKEKLYHQSFTASENTMNRIDRQINQIIGDGYNDGWGINQVASNITRRFDQLSDWESKRIARTEIHNAHNMGIMNTYEEMGVEYTQWIAARDARTRDTHREINGEIIPMGGTYSNDLRYPGDTTGPLKEWINCRCSNAPFIMPDGYIAPSFSPFREEDLIQTLDYWNQNELLESIDGVNVNGELYGIELNPELMKSKFGVANEDISDFGIDDKGLEVIQGFTKRRFGADKEYGLAFNEKTGKILTKEFRGTKEDVLIKPPRGKYSTIHYHTDESLRPPSHGDFESFLRTKKEKVGINVSKKETWLIKSEHKFNQKEIDDITSKINSFEEKQITKMQKEYHKAKLEINKIKDPKQRESAKKKLDEYTNNEFLDYHNKELGNNILEYTSKIKGLKVKRIVHQEVDKNTIKSLDNLKIDKSNNMGLSKFSKQVNDESKLSPRVALRKKVMASEKDMFALTKDERKYLDSIEQKQRKGENLKFHEKRALPHFKEKEYYNDMRNQIIDRSAMTNENFDWDYFEELHKKFKDWSPLKPLNEIQKIKVEIPSPKKIFEKPNLFDLSAEETKILKNIESNLTLIKGMGEDKSQYYEFVKTDLRDKRKLAEFHKRAFDNEYGLLLNERESKEYVDLYLKHQKQWNLPNIDLNAYVSVPDKRIWDTFQISNNFPISDRFKLTSNEDELLKKLMKHKFLRGGKVSPKNEKYIQLLKDQRDFNDLYSLRLTKKGLSYKEDKLYRELAERLTKNGYDVLATTKNPELSIFKELHVIHKTELKLKEGAKRYKTIKGLTYDGSIPQGLEIDDLFTFDTRNLSKFEKDIYYGWLTNEYRNYRAYFTTCKRNKECYAKWLRDHPQRGGTSAEELEYNWKIIKNINKNQLKKNIRLFRRQRNHHLADDKPSGIPEIGDCVTFHGFNSTAITKEGADYCAQSMTHGADDWEDQFKWLIEIEAPTGTQGAYVAPITTKRFMPEMEFLLQEETRTIIKEFNPDNHHAVVQVVNECPKRK